MKLFQKLTKVLKKFKLMLIKFLLNGKEINLTGDDITIESTNFNVDKNGNMTCNNAELTGGRVEIYGGTEINQYGDGLNFKCVQSEDIQYPYSGMTPQMLVLRNGQSSYINLQVGSVSEPLSTINALRIQSNFSNYISHTAYSGSVGSTWHASNGTTYVNGSGIETPTLTQTSLESKKKNFEKFENALSIIKDIDIYKYNLKSEKDTDKKHIGFVIGNNYKYRKEVTSQDNTGVDDYSFTSLCCRAIQEQQEIIESSNSKINKLEKIIKILNSKINKLEEK